MTPTISGALVIEIWSVAHGGGLLQPLRTIQVKGEDVTPAFREQLAEQEQWDYEQVGVTRPFLVVGGGLIPFSLAEMMRHPGEDGA